MIKLIGNPKINAKCKLYANEEEIKTTLNCKIYDARGYYAAIGNMLGGKGYEHP